MTPTRSIAVSVVAPASQSGGAYALMDVTAPAGLEVDPHVAGQEDLHLWVLAGGVTVVLDGVVHRLSAGDDLRLPRRVPRALAVSCEARVLCLSVPAGFEAALRMAADATVAADDRAAILAAAGVDRLPRSLWRPLTDEPTALERRGDLPTPQGESRRDKIRVSVRGGARCRGHGASADSAP